MVIVGVEPIVGLRWDPVGANPGVHLYSHRVRLLEHVRQRIELRWRHLARLRLAGPGRAAVCGIVQRVAFLPDLRDDDVVVGVVGRGDHCVDLAGCPHPGVPTVYPQCSEFLCVCRAQECGQECRT